MEEESDMTNMVRTVSDGTNKTDNIQNFTSFLSVNKRLFCQTPGDDPDSV